MCNCETQLHYPLTHFIDHFPITHTDPSDPPLHGITWPSESRTVVQSLVFYILFTAPNFWAWKFYTQKCVNLRHKLHESTLFYTIWNICPFSGKPAPRQMVFRAGNTVLAHCWEEAYCYASRNNTFKHGLHHKQDLFNTLSYHLLISSMSILCL